MDNSYHNVSPNANGMQYNTLLLWSCQPLLLSLLAFCCFWASLVSYSVSQARLIF